MTAAPSARHYPDNSAETSTEKQTLANVGQHFCASQTYQVVEVSSNESDEEEEDDVIIIE